MIAAPTYQPLCLQIIAELQDQDQEVKECAISCMAAAVAALGDVLGADVAQVRRDCYCCPSELPPLLVLLLCFLLCFMLCLDWVMVGRVSGQVWP